MARQGKKSKTRSRLRKVIWTTFVVLFWLGGLALGTAIGYLSLANEGIVGRTVIAYIKGDIKPENAFPAQDRVTVLIVGTDENRHRKRVVEPYARADSIAVVQFDFANQRINALSIPRDTLVRIPGHGWGKINAAHVLGGPKLLVETVSKLLGDIPIDEVIIVNYQAVVEAVDALGGVTIEVEKRMRYHDFTGDLHIDLKPGVHHLNGKQALGYVRFRHTDSDFYRIERQQKFMRAVKERIKQPSVWLRVPQALSSALRHTKTTMSYEQLLALALFARGLEDHQIRTETLPVRPGHGTYLIVLRDKAENLLRDMGFWDTDPHYSYAR